jgi:hypothetical protein
LSKWLHLLLKHFTKHEENFSETNQNMKQKASKTLCGVMRKVLAGNPGIISLLPIKG